MRFLLLKHVLRDTWCVVRAHTNVRGTYCRQSDFSIAVKAESIDSLSVELASRLLGVDFDIVVITPIGVKDFRAIGFPFVENQSSTTVRTGIERQVEAELMQTST